MHALREEISDLVCGVGQPGDEVVALNAPVMVAISCMTLVSKAPTWVYLTLLRVPSGS